MKSYISKTKDFLNKGMDAAKDNITTAAKKTKKITTGFGKKEKEKEPIVRNTDQNLVIDQLTPSKIDQGTITNIPIIEKDVNLQNKIINQNEYLSTGECNVSGNINNNNIQKDEVLVNVQELQKHVGGRVSVRICFFS